MRLVIALVLISCLLFAGCTVAPEKTGAANSSNPSPTKMLPLSPKDELYSDQLDRSIEELDLVG